MIEIFSGDVTELVMELHNYAAAVPEHLIGCVLYQFGKCYRFISLMFCISILISHEHVSLVLGPVQ